MPWTYGAEGVRIARDLFRLRYRLLPYIYTMTRAAHDEALPLVRPLYIMHPDLEEAYHHQDEYYFGDGMLVAPIVDSSGVRDVYLPPGEWVDYFSGARYPGDRTIRSKCSLETLPLFVRSGSIITQQPDMEYTDQKPLDSLIVDVYAPGNSIYSLYEDDGISLDYGKGKSAITPIACAASGSSCKLTIGPTTGEYDGQPVNRAYLVRVVGIPEPATVSVNGAKVAPGGSSFDHWNWDAGRQILNVSIVRRSIRGTVTLEMR
jgi:alpha-glucosidase (family GH31 glycosyl hydrolase)